MRKYEIWSEGYRATGDKGNAWYHGEQEAESFQEACDIFFADPKNDSEGYYNSKTLTLWACHLFDNEEDARKTFG